MQFAVTVLDWPIIFYWLTLTERNIRNEKINFKSLLLEIFMSEMPKYFTSYLRNNTDHLSCHTVWVLVVVVLDAAEPGVEG